MKAIEVVAAIIRRGDSVFATQRGYGEWKDYWEFPGGKVEAGETREEALRREIREELETEISVDGFLCTVDYDYPAFHLTMHCYRCSVLSGSLHLVEHEAARWLAADELDSVLWLPADLSILPLIAEITDETSLSMKKKLVVINACVRQKESRTLRIAEPIITSLSERYSVIRYDLPEMDGIVPLNPKLFEERGKGDIPAWAVKAAKDIAQADRIVIAAPFWDMSFPAVLKCFFEQTSLFDITFTDNGQTCVGLCKAPKVLYITTRGMDIPTGDPREQATPYLKALGSLWNLGELTTIAAWNMDYSSKAEIERRLSACIAEGLELARDW